MIIIAEVSELTRKIKLPTDRVISVNGDYQVDGIAFKLPATYEGDFDFSTAAVRVHWTGVDKVEHTNLITEEDGNGYPLWIMPSELTQGGHGVIEFAVSFIATDETAAVTKRWISDPVSFRNRRTVNGSSEDEAEEEAIYDRLASAIAAVRAAQASVDKVNEVLAGITNSSPVVVATAADLSDLDVTKHQLAIVRADGYLYYYDGSAWQKGIKYGSYELDTTLTESGKAADAAAVGAKISQIKEDLSGLPESVEEMGKRLDLTTEGVPNAQIVNTSGIDITNNGGLWGFRNVEFPVSDGKYYHNPIDDGSDTNQRHYFGHGYKFLNANHDEITITQNGTIVSDMPGDRSTCVWVISGTTVTMYMYLNYNDFISEKLHSANVYTLSEEPAYIRATLLALKVDTSTDKNDAVAGMTKDTWSTDYKPYGGFDYRYTDRLIDAIEDSVDASNSKVIAPMYDATVTYAVNDYVLYGGKLYKCIAAISNAEAWNSAHWEESLLTDEFKDLSAIQTATTDDVGKALKVKAVAGGKVTEWEFGDAGGSEITVPEYSQSKQYPVGSYVMHDGVMYRSNVPITTAEAWTAEHWTAITTSDLIADINERLDMVVTMQEVQEDEPVEGIVQLVDLSKLDWRQQPSGLQTGKYLGYPTEYINLKGDGDYYQNPFGVAVTTNGKWEFTYAKFCDAEGNALTLTNVKDGSTKQYLTLFNSSKNDGHFTIENGRTLKYYQSDNTLTTTYTTEADIAKMAYADPNGPHFSYFDNETTKFGITYGGKSESYVPYEGAEPTYEYNYVPKMAKYVEKYMQAHGTAVDNNIFNYVCPETDNTAFVNAVKYYHERADRQRNDIIRIGSFNKFVVRGQSNWATIKQELADYSIDICGFQECAAIQSGGTVTTQIGEYLKGWQFKDYAVQDAVVDKALVTHWKVTQTDLITLLTYDNGAGTSNCIHALMTIGADKWYSNAVNANATLSVYCYHGSSGGKTIDGVSYSSYQVRQIEINALLAVIANDTADFIVIVGDTNAFETGFNISTGTHHEWEMFRDAGFTPVLDGTDSTVTADLQDKYFCKADNGKVYCIACYDQIFIGANISVERFGVVDSNLYPVESTGGEPVSDHCMVYADLKFDFDAIMQNKLKDIAVTEPWW